MASENIKVYIRVSDIFPNVESNFETFKSLLDDLSLTDSVLWCARLNLIISDSSAIDLFTRQKFFLDEFLTEEDVKMVSEFAKRHGGWSNIGIIFRGQILELLRWVVLFCYDHSGDGNTFSKLEIRRKFTQALLIVSDLWARRLRLSENMRWEEDIELVRRKSLGSIRKNIESTLQSLDLQRTIGRGWSLFGTHFPKFYPSFCQEFLDLTGGSVKEYYRFPK